jgi:hypothetical protein
MRKLQSRRSDHPHLERLSCRCVRGDPATGGAANIQVQRPGSTNHCGTTRLLRATIVGARPQHSEQLVVVSGPAGSTLDFECEVPEHTEHSLRRSNLPRISARHTAARNRAPRNNPRPPWGRNGSLLQTEFASSAPATTLATIPTSRCSARHSHKRVEVVLSCRRKEMPIWARRKCTRAVVMYRKYVDRLGVRKWRPRPRRAGRASVCQRSAAAGGGRSPPRCSRPLESSPGVRSHGSSSPTRRSGRPVLPMAAAIRERTNSAPSTTRG